MTEPRLKSEFTVAAHMHTVHRAGASAIVARRGDPDAGARAVKIYLGNRQARLLAGSRDVYGRHIWRDPLSGKDITYRIFCIHSEYDVDAWLENETLIDPDLWIVEVHDREGRSFLEES